ncbi:hypothetical protein [Halarcobacter sp.]|uniref:hypothetical protein n=1 Tax=Halarcobacter sp. TaxID=2321133 RepID=UPI0029F56BE3|nr:hypothetical protein [Halarcobacter sp.]
MNTKFNNFKPFDEYAKETYLSMLHSKQLKTPQAHITDEDRNILENKCQAFTKNNYEVSGEYLEDIIISHKNEAELEIHNTMLLVDKNTGEVLSEDFHIIDKEHIKLKRKELNSLNYYKKKFTKAKATSKVKVENYKSSHRYTKLFSKVRPSFKNHKYLGIFYDLTRELSPYENIVSKQNNDGTFTPLTTKEIQERFNISPDDMKRFKAEAKRLKVISDVKLKGRTLGIRVNPFYALNGQDISEDLYEAFKDSKEFIENFKED